MRRFMAVVLLAPASAMALDDIVGAWAVDGASCRESRLILDFEGNYSTVIADEGRWRSTGVAAYRREGNSLVVTSGEGEERLEILVEERDRLVLRNRASPPANNTMELLRCPAY